MKPLTAWLILCWATIKTFYYEWQGERTMASYRQRNQVLCHWTTERRVEHYERRRSRQVESRKPRNDTMYGRWTDDTRRLQHYDHCDRIKPHRFSSETSEQDGLHLYQYVSSLSTCHGTSDPSKQGRRADLHLRNKKKITKSVLWQ